MVPSQAPTPSPTLPPPAPPKTDGLAVTSLVLGICAITCCFFYGIVAITLGLKSRERIKQSNGVLTGDGLALAGVITGCVGLAVAIFQIAVLAEILFPSIDHAKEKANRVSCAHVLRSISLACKAYATDDENGMLPPNFKALMPNYITDPKIFVCPSAPNAHQPIGDNLNRDYVYFGDGHKDAEIGADTVLIADSPNNHHGRFINVVLGDGHVEAVPLPHTTDLRSIAGQHGWKIPVPK